MTLPSIMDEIRLNSINSRAPFVIVHQECGTLVSEHQALSDAIHALQRSAKADTEEPSIYYRQTTGWLKLWPVASWDSHPLELNTPSNQEVGV